MPHNDQARKAQMPDVVYLVKDTAFTWRGHTFQELCGFLDDVEKLGHAVLKTPTTIYVFAGEGDQ